jgi:hypothetical protein
MKNYILLLLLLTVFILLVSIDKSPFKDQLKFNTKSIKVQFLGIGKDAADAKLIKVGGFTSSFPYPDESRDFDLFHYSGDNFETFKLGTSRTQSDDVWAGDTVDYYNYLTYSDLVNPPEVSCKSGDFISTSDLAGTTSYQIIFGRVDDPSGVDVNTNDNIITIDTDKVSDYANVQFVHNLNNNKNIRSVTFKFPQNESSLCSCTKIKEFSNAGNIIYNSSRYCTIGNQITLIPRIFGFDITNPQIKMILFMATLNGCVTHPGGISDAGPWINQAILAGYTIFTLVEDRGHRCWYIDLTYRTKFVASGNPGKPDSVSPYFSWSHC